MGTTKKAYCPVCDELASSLTGHQLMESWRNVLRQHPERGYCEESYSVSNDDNGDITVIAKHLPGHLALEQAIGHRVASPSYMRCG